MFKSVASVLLVGVFALGCGGGVKQKRPNVDEEVMGMSGESDIAEEPSDIAPVVEKKLTPEEKRGLCCAECVKGKQNDRSGDDPATIPCADFTADLSEKCLKHFRTDKVMASDAEACAAAAPAPATPSADAEAGPADPNAMDQ